MSPSSDTGPAASTAAPKVGERSDTPQNWREALMTLLATRVDLIKLESKVVAGGFARRAGFHAAAAFFAVFAWALLLTGAIGVISETTEWPWSWVCIGIAVLHLLLAILFSKLASPKAKAAFPVTRAEFQKDREWIENLHKTTKSNG